MQYKIIQWNTKIAIPTVRAGGGSVTIILIKHGILVEDELATPPSCPLTPHIDASLLFLLFFFVGTTIECYTSDWMHAVLIFVTRTGGWQSYRTTWLSKDTHCTLH
jgi:hypothetical protein